MRSIIASLAFVLTLFAGADAQALSWFTNGPSGGSIHSFAVAPSSPGRIYVGTERGLYRSDDDGVTWIEPWSE